VPGPPRELRVAGQGAMALPWCALVWLPSCFRVIPCSSEGIIVRDSVNQAGATLRYSFRTWRTFLARAKMGKFDVKTELTGGTANSPLRESDFRAVKV
jgi:hypothetical protein